MAAVAQNKARVDWVDYAKGICIIFVVMMHSTLGVEQAAGHDGFMHAVVEFARPFRMPDFFLISGLFLSRVIDRDWRTYLDRKVAHFGYFYVLWVTIQFAVKAPAFVHTEGLGVVTSYLEAFIQPFGTLWFIYLLPIFFVVTKLTRRVPPVVVFLIAAALQIVPIDTGSVIIDEFCQRFVFFFTGYWMAQRVFELAADAQARPRAAVLGLMFWASVEAGLVWHGQADWPLVSLLLGLAGACAVVSVAALLARFQLLQALRYLGEHSIVIYLSFFLPMMLTREALLRSGLSGQVGLVSVLVTIAGVLGALVIWAAARGAGANFLFERPARFRIAPSQRVALMPAE